MDNRFIYIAVLSLFAAFFVFEMPIAFGSTSDFNKTKQLDVTSVSGNPTISRTQTLKIVSGDDSTTGTGDIVLDWTNIADESDIAIYDESGNLLDYYIESFDATNETATIWVYRDWVRDGSTQAQVAYGDGPSDQSVNASTVFDKESDLRGGWLLNETSGGALDVTSNNNDGTTNGGVTRGVNGAVDGAYDFDGTNDNVEVPHDSSLNITGDMTISMKLFIDSYTDGSWDMYVEKASDGYSGYALYSSGSDNLISFNMGSSSDWYDVSYTIGTGSWHHLVVVHDDSRQETSFYVDNNLVENLATNNLDPTYTGSLNVADPSWSDTDLHNGKIDHLTIRSSAISNEDRTAMYDSTKSSPDFFSQQAVETTGDGGGAVGGTIGGVWEDDGVSGLNVLLFSALFLVVSLFVMAGFLKINGSTSDNE